MLKDTAQKRCSSDPSTSPSSAQHSFLKGIASLSWNTVDNRKGSEKAIEVYYDLRNSNTWLSVLLIYYERSRLTSLVYHYEYDMNGTPVPGGQSVT